MKILMLDEELAPNLATVWGIYNQNIGINQLLETSRVLCFVAKWYGDDDIMFYSEHDMAHEDMIKKLWELLDEADAVCHYNGNKFDIPVANREFLLYGMKPPAPYKNIDLIETVRKQFRFVSNKLDHICNELDIGSKVKHEGHELWLKCMNGDDVAWKTMEEYNIQDVQLLEELYESLKPWIMTHPNHALYTDTTRPICTNCGSEHVIKRGVTHTAVQSYQRYHCEDCGTWLRGRYTISDKDKRHHILRKDFTK